MPAFLHAMPVSMCRPRNREDFFMPFVNAKDVVKAKLKHWRGFQVICAMKAAPVLEF